MDLITVIGARPQFIKAAITSRALEAHGLTEALVLTGQHYDENMSHSFVKELNMSSSIHYLSDASSKTALTIEDMQTRLVQLIGKLSPKAVLVYGDTDSTLAAARAAHACDVVLIHVEAGLRSFNPRMREEFNRIETDKLSALLFAPTHTAAANLAAESNVKGEVKVCGDVMYDLFKETASKLEAVDTSATAAKDCKKPRLLLTTHRAENVDDLQRLPAILTAMEELSNDMTVRWPLHPRTRKRLLEQGLLARLEDSRIDLLTPLGYEDMVREILLADVICTDSGGLQKEAFFGSKPCVTIRDETEWTELIDAGWNQLCPPISATAIHNAIKLAIGTVGENVSPYGDGFAAKVIALDTLHFLKTNRSGSKS